MKILAVMLLACAYMLTGSAQTKSDCIRWDQVDSFVIYNWPAGGSFSLLRTKLDSLTGYPLPVEMLKEVLPGTSCEKKTTGYLWKGYHLGKVMLRSGEQRLLLISTQGEMLYEPDTKRFYEVPNDQVGKMHEALVQAVQGKAEVASKR